MENELKIENEPGSPSQLQSQASAPAEPAHAQHRNTDDRRVFAALLLQLALGVGFVCGWLDSAICRTRD